MTLETWLIYVAAVLVLTITPGPSVLLCVSNSINHGFKRAALSAFGSIAAVSCIMALSAVGLGALLATSEVVFQIVKWTGAAYLLYLGIKLLFQRSNGKGFEPDTSSSDTGSRRALSFFTQGLLVGASNPKALVFFSALFPQFLNPAAPQLPQFLVLCTTFVVFEAFWLLTYAGLASRIAPWLRQRGRQLIFDRLCGATFVTAGALLLTLRRSNT
jgi:threonine/homoserine/homoserine lactone efflux protein